MDEKITSHYIKYAKALKTICRMCRYQKLCDFCPAALNIKMMRVELNRKKRDGGKKNGYRI